MKYTLAFITLIATLGCAPWQTISAADPTPAKPVDYMAMRDEVESLANLTQAPKYERLEKGDATPNLQTILYDGPEYKGKATTVFAWLGLPEKRDGKVPAVVLVHGGGGAASKDWVKNWNKHGYAAISMSLEGQTEFDPKNKEYIKNTNGGPSRSGIFGDSVAPIQDQWMYQCVADVTLAANLLRSLPEIDADKIGIVGCSWGGIITSTVIGIDPRYAFAIPVYGCGGLDAIPNQYGRALANNEVYKKVWDANLRLEKARMPILWLSWPQDAHFSMHAIAQSSKKPGHGNSMLCLIPGMGHGNLTDRPEWFAFADSVLKDGRPWVRPASSKLEGGKLEAVFDSTKSLDSAVLVSTTDSGFTGSRKWSESPAKVTKIGDQWMAAATLPAGTTACFINVKSGQLTGTSEYNETVDQTKESSKLKGTAKPTTSHKISATTTGQSGPGAQTITGGDVTMSFDGEGKPLSFTRSNGRNLIRKGDPGSGFVLTYGTGDSERVVPLTSWESKDGKLLASGADQSRVTFTVSAGQTHIAFRIERIENIPAGAKPVLSFIANFENVCPQVVPLDYMTVSKGEWASKRCFISVSWPYLWRRGDEDPLGGFAFFVPLSDEEHNESLLHIWAEENLPHPKITGEWTVEHARQWVKEWQETFPRCDQLTICAKKPEDLDVLIEYGKKLKVNRLYLHTDTWRGAYWVYDRDPLHVNTQVFPRGEVDLKAFNDKLKANNMDAMLHTICYGFGLIGSKYVGEKTDRRLANWGKGKLEKSVSATEKTIFFRPDPGVEFPSPGSYGAWWKMNDVLIEDEIVRCKFTYTDQPVWTLTDCQRGTYATKHEAGTVAIGLLKAYDQNYYPSSMTTLCEETAKEYAEFFNRLGIRHHEYDGGECHDDVPWGYSKWTMFVYQHTDHPITSNSSSGLPNPWDLVYRFKSGGSSILEKRGGGNAALFLHEPRRLATSPIENHLTLARGAAANCSGFNFLKPEPMFGLSPGAIEGHGLAPLIAEQFSNWREVAGKLSIQQRKLISETYYHDSSPYPLDAGHAVSKLAFEARKTANGLEVQPFCIMTRGKDDVEWKTVQEFGPILPRQYVLPGMHLRLENPFPHQSPQFIIRVMSGLSEGIAIPAGGSREVNKDLAGYLQGAGVKQPSTDVTKLNSAGTFDNKLQPTATQIQEPGRHKFTDNSTALEIALDNSQHEEYFQKEGLPSYRVKGNSQNARGLAITVTGDGSRAFLLIQTTKDYVIPIDFKGRKEIVIPCGEVAWATGRWGLRYSSKGAGYGPFNRVAIGFGRVPAKTSAKVLVENLRVMGEQPSLLKNPVIHAGTGTLSISGEVKSDQYLWYQGGHNVGVYDLNWQLITTLPVVSKEFTVDRGFSEFWIEGQSAKPQPWLDVQFISKGEVMAISN